MKKQYEKKYHELETNNWWFTSRRDMITRLVNKNPKKSRILDIGCSSGELIKELKKKGYKKVTGIDISEQAIKECQRKKIRNIYLMNAEKITLKKRFDIIIASDVLEHIKNDEKAIKEWEKKLTKKGKIICFVPAFKQLWSRLDEENKHHKRYTLKELTKKFKKQGFKINKKSYWNCSLFIPSLITKIISRITKKENQLFKPTRTINKILETIIKNENKITEHINLPIGVSAFIIATKQENQHDPAYK